MEGKSMNYAVYNIALDIHKTGSQVALSMIRGENKRRIVVSLMENGRPYKITNGCTAMFSATKPDGKFIYNDCEIDFENNLIIYNVTSQTTAAMGEVKCQIELIGSDGGLLFSPTFSLIVANKLYNQEPILESSEEFLALTNYLADLHEMVDNGVFNGEKGDKGDKGDQGPQGIQGETGAAGKDADVSELAPAIVCTSTGTAIAISDSSESGFEAFSIYGKSTQDGTPTPDTPIDIVSVGDDGTLRVTINDNALNLSVTNQLKSIPVTDKSIATYTDASGKMWCADEIDLARGVVVQRVLLQKLVLSEGHSYGTDGYMYHALSKPLVKGNLILSTHYLGLSTNGTGASFKIPGFNSLLEYETFITNNDVYVQYVLATPIETPLTSEQIAAYKALKTNYPSTTILNDENAFMKVGYRADTKNFIKRMAGSTTQISSVSLPASKWVGTASPYSQVVNISGTTENSKIDLNPTVEQLSIFHNKDIAFVVGNNKGVTTVYCIGQKPTNDYTMQVTITEVAKNV